MRRVFATTILLTTLAFTAPTTAGMDDFHPGKAIPNYGMITDVDMTMPLPKGLVLKHTFDRADGAESGKRNRNIESAARFINMHHAHGIALDNIKTATVVHGAAIFDVTNNEFYNKTKGTDNANKALIEALLKAGSRVIVCGQSAKARDIPKSALLPGVELSLSAMTAHALLQQEGYTLNPF